VASIAPREQAHHPPIRDHGSFIEMPTTRASASIGEAQYICLDVDELTIGESTGLMRRLTVRAG